MALLKTNKHPRNRRQVSRAQPKQPLTAIIVPTVSTVTVTLTSNVPVLWKGIPLSFSVATVTVESITVVSPTVAQLHLSGSGAGKAWSLGPNDPAIRTYTGGYAAAAAGTFP